MNSAIQLLHAFAFYLLTCTPTHLFGHIDDGGRRDVLASMYSAVKPNAPPVSVVATRTDFTQLQATQKQDIILEVNITRVCDGDDFAM